MCKILDMHRAKYLQSFIWGLLIMDISNFDVLHQYDDGNTGISDNYIDKS